MGNLCICGAKDPGIACSHFSIIKMRYEMAWIWRDASFYLLPSSQKFVKNCFFLIDFFILAKMKVGVLKVH